MSPNDWPPSTSPSKSDPPANSVGIVIPVKDGLKFFKLCFHSVLSFTDHPYLLTIVDNDSTLSTKKYFRMIANNHPINVLRYEADFNFAAEVNLGCRYVFSFPNVKYALILNADAVVSPNYLSNLIRAINSNPKIGAVGPVSNKAIPEQMDSGRFNTLSVSQRLSGFCMLFRREAFDEVGGFDEEYQGGGFEDWQFCESIRRRGWHTVIDGFTYIHHFYRSFRRNDHNESMLANEALFFKKNPLLKAYVEKREVVLS